MASEAAKDSRRERETKITRDRDIERQRGARRGRRGERGVRRLEELMRGQLMRGRLRVRQC